MDKCEKNEGILYICATPIGNLEDITLRVLRILKEVDFIAAEDTRHTIKLLNYYNIQTPLTSYHEHNKYSKGQAIIKRLQNGETAALTSDAGTPAISDPGYDLIKLCIENGIKYTICPGASAVISALVLSGLKTDSFCFDGFLPNNKKERENKILSYTSETRTIIIYESPHKLIGTLNELKKTLGEQRNATISREITKAFEETDRNTLGGLCELYEKKDIRGEIVILIEGVDPKLLEIEAKRKWTDISIDAHMEIYLNKGMNDKDAMKSVAKDRGLPKSEIYSYWKK